MRQDYALARDRYKPSGRIKLLLVAESPPASGGYFYFENTTGRDYLFRETMKALKLLPEGRKVPRSFDKRCLLERFQSLGLMHWKFASNFQFDRTKNRLQFCRYEKARLEQF